MLSGGKWRELVPKEVADFIVERKGVGRLKEVSKGDKYGVVA